MQMTAVISSKGRLVELAWLLIPAAILAPFFFWRGAAWGIVLLLAVLIGAGAIWLRAVSFVAAVSADTLSLYGGVVFPFERRIPRESICGMARIATPLLDVAGCRILLLYTPSGTIFLPGLSRADAEQLCVWAQAAPGPEAAL